MAPPHFTIVKILTPCDISPKLVLPAAIASHIELPVGSHYKKLRVMDSLNQERTFVYYTRANARYAKPVFTTGWHQFVQDKNLQVGDKFVFTGHQERDETGEVQMKYVIEMSRASGVTFQGEPIYLNVENFL